MVSNNEMLKQEKPNIFTDYDSGQGAAIGRVRLSVCFFPL